ncbi:MAG: hypothetical protein IH988_01010 [Planctomycetes bacterium]|nr:hypothetical protein [Planctomycetota bacterium]
MLIVAGGAFAVTLAIQLVAILHSAWLAKPSGSLLSTASVSERARAAR